MRLEVVAGVAVAATTAAIALAGGDEPSPRTPEAMAPASGPVIRGGRGARVTRTPDLSTARLVARRFLGGYLRFLYGRGSARAVPHASATVREGLARARARVTPAQHGRRPRVVDLELIAQDARVMIATAHVVDGGVATYPLTFSLALRGGRWLVNSLGSD